MKPLSPANAPQSRLNTSGGYKGTVGDYRVKALLILRNRFKKCQLTSISW